MMVRFYSIFPSANIFCGDNNCLRFLFLHFPSSLHLLLLREEICTNAPASQKPLRVICARALFSQLGSGIRKWGGMVVGRHFSVESICRYSPVNPSLSRIGGRAWNRPASRHMHGSALRVVLLGRIAARTEANQKKREYATADFLRESLGVLHDLGAQYPSICRPYLLSVRSPS